MKRCKFIKKKYNEIKKCFSVPIYIYVMLLVISVILMVVQICDCKFAKDVLANIGYSLFASLIAAVFIDYGNNKLHNQKQLKEFSQLTYEHSELANDFYFSISGLYKQIYSSQPPDVSFSEMVDNILDPDYKMYNVKKQAHKECIDAIVSFLKKFCTESQNLENKLVDHIENRYSTGSYRHQLRMIKYYSEKIINLIDNGNYACASDLIIYKLFPAIAKTHPDTSEFFL